ncbi:MAG: FHA domain-containing protein [Verrucomicrobiales bacterium]|nr:FHA domain-containing protein [Verrucomicrobiales bacterium]
MPIRITILTKDRRETRTFAQDRLVIGRSGTSAQADVSLSGDSCVSHRHARVELRPDGCWIIDLGSSNGTWVNGREIRDRGECRLQPTDRVRIGETELVFEGEPTAPAGGVPSSGRGAERDPAPDAPAEPQVLQSVKTDASLAIRGVSLDTAREQRLAWLCGLPVEFARQKTMDELLALVVRRVVEIVPAARRGAVLLRRKSDEPLVLKSYVAEDEPAVSLTLAARALERREAVVWRRQTDGDPTQSMRRLNIDTGAYVPLLWQDQALGVLCVDTPDSGQSFGEDDLRVVMSVAQYAAVAIANHQLQEDLRRHARLLERLLTNFSPKLRKVLLDRAEQGRLRLGGEHSEVTLLMCDLCGFTRTSAQLDTGDVVEMLNDYLHTVADVIFRHDGTIDKYIGDAVLAVFGSPEPDTAQWGKALRAAVEIQARIKDVNERRGRRSEAVCQALIGVHCGSVFHGFVGTMERLEFTVIGDPVNRTARYCSAAGPGEVIISPPVYQRVFSLAEARQVTVGSKEGELAAYSVGGLRL